MANTYHVIGKSLTTGKAQDFKVEGEVVAHLISLARVANGGKFDKRGLTKAMSLPGLPPGV
jgi:hypothetical protein